MLILSTSRTSILGINCTNGEFLMPFLFPNGVSRNWKKSLFTSQGWRKNENMRKSLGCIMVNGVTPEVTRTSLGTPFAFPHIVPLYQKLHIILLYFPNIKPCFALVLGVSASILVQLPILIWSWFFPHVVLIFSCHVLSFFTFVFFYTVLQPSQLFAVKPGRQTENWQGGEGWGKNSPIPFC